MASDSASSATFRDRDYYAIDEATLTELKHAAYSDPKKRARICLHATHDELIQEMIIALAQGHPIPPHRQPGKRKTYCMIEGSLLISFYADDGSRKNQVLLEKTGTQVLTFPASDWHSCEATTEMAIYLEIQPGPFHPAGTEWLHP